jgi:hypothetical protein
MLSSSGNRGLEKDGLELHTFLAFSRLQNFNKPTEVLQTCVRVGIAAGYEQVNRGIVFRFPTQAKYFSLSRRVQIGYGTQSPSFLLSTGFLSPGLKRPEREGDLSCYLVLT